MRQVPVKHFRIRRHYVVAVPRLWPGHAAGPLGKVVVVLGAERVADQVKEDDGRTGLGHSTTAQPLSNNYRVETEVAGRGVILRRKVLVTFTDSALNLTDYRRPRVPETRITCRQSNMESYCQ